MFQTLPPVIAYPADFPGQMGVPGSASGLGLRMIPGGRAYYVAKTTEVAIADDNNDGTDPLAPLATIGGAITRIETAVHRKGASVIFVGPGTYTENLTVTDTDLPDDVFVVGLGKVIVTPSAAATQTLSQGKRWHWSGIEFRLGTATGITLTLSASLDAGGSIFTDCLFNGQGNCAVGVDLAGAPSDVRFINCDFYNVYNGSNNGEALTTSANATDESDRLLLQDCRFFDNDSHIDLPCNVSHFIRVSLAAAGNKDVAVVFLDLRGGTVGHNVMQGCLFDGDYSNTGGYYDNASGASIWAGNIATDTAEAEVGDNGWVIAAPAA